MTGEIVMNKTMTTCFTTVAFCGAATVASANPIVHCVRRYLRFKLSFRDLVEMMAERGLAVAHTTIMRWAQRFVPEFERRWNRYSPPISRLQKLDT
jgi:transposase-like protein